MNEAVKTKNLHSIKNEGLKKLAATYSPAYRSTIGARG
ncbi:hypothetical protein BXY58_0843, partial [Epilithonimonas arachidiradicis]